ncbi:MAG: hypothetical protein PHE58_05465, partial [Candidatus Omnitrophica bacterium]|nr:hypothetical protein [Candidatus Omnitrophota bacterium]
MRASRRIKRYFEIIPGVVTWSILVFLVFLAVVKPVTCALIVIVFDFYWIIRSAYLTTLLIMAHHKLRGQKNIDWEAACRELGQDKNWREIYQLVLFPVYKEGIDILRPSLESLKYSRYPKDRLIVVLSFEGRYPQARETAAILEKEFEHEFFAYVTTVHPDGLPGERRVKGANATWGARKAKEFINAKGIAYDRVIISCFDADTCVDKGYFGCLTHHFLTNAKPHQASYQPIPVYNNNIWHAPSFARLVEISSSFCQLIESMRLEKFVTF